MDSDNLAKLLADMGGFNEIPDSNANSQNIKKQTAKLKVAIEKKGRGGKTATIISGFDIDDQQVNLIAAEIKKALATGGSARGGEILIQGDRKNDVLAFLKQKGFKI